MANAGQSDKAIEALIAFGGEAPLHPIVRELLDEIRSGKAVAPLAATTEAGVAEALYGLGSAIGLDDGAELSAAYLRLAAHLAPNNHLITMAIGDAFQGVERCADAIEIYETVPGASSMRRNADIQIGACLQSLERYGDATEYLKRVVSANKDDAEAAVQLGNAFRADSRFAEAADVYTQALAVNGDPKEADWRIYYFRGVSFERSKRWPEAESDFRTALELNPDQPQVLNYLGYSLVDQGLKLDEALDMIKKAVGQRPEDAYIVDSLGWAFYQLDQLDDAVRELERAVQLQPEDPVINDHLGDVYWKTGRKLEAIFQWTHARDLEPEKDQLPKILAKLKGGLDAEPPAESGAP
jgi:tetratricopeptide (TPR) repeat protein